MAASDTDVLIGWEDTVHGPRRYLGIAGLSLALFLTGVEATIVGTSLVTITKDLKHFGQSSWVITSYLLTYTGFVMIWNNSGDIYGVKPALLASLFIFMAFSGGCAAAQSLNQLIVCRAFQGMGGAGVYSLALFSFARIMPYEQYDIASSVAGGVISLGFVLGPLLGGAIANDGNWLWVFLYNIPAGAIACLLIFFALPPHFPNTFPALKDKSSLRQIWANAKSSFRQIDIIGASLVLTACSFIIAALQEGNFEYPWSSGLVISFFVISAVFWIAFVWWEWFICRHGVPIRPMLPWRLTHNRTFMGVALGFFTTGLPLTVCSISIPQRFQIVNGSSPILAGVELLSFALACPIGMIACSVLAGRFRLPFCYIALFGIACQSTGLFLFSGIPSVEKLWLRQFGYLALAGLGTGIGMAAFYMALSLVVDCDDQSIAMGIGIQLRMLGGVLGVAISTAILFHYLKGRLSSEIQPAELATLLNTFEAIETFSPEVQVRVRDVYAMAYSMHMKLAGASSLAQLLAVAIVWKRQNVRYSKR